MIPHSTPDRKLKFTEVYLVSLKLHVCEPGSWESRSGFTQFPRWPWGCAGCSPSVSPTPCLALFCVGGRQSGENWLTPTGVSSLVNYLPWSLCFSLPLRKPPPQTEALSGFYRTASHCFTPSASAERAWEQSRRCSASPVPHPESCHLGHACLSPSILQAWEDPRLGRAPWTRDHCCRGPPSTKTVTPAACPPLTCKSWSGPMSLWTTGSSEEPVSGFSSSGFTHSGSNVWPSDWVGAHIQTVSPERLGKGTLISAWSEIGTWPRLISCCYYWDEEREFIYLE